MPLPKPRRTRRSHNIVFRATEQEAQLIVGKAEQLTRGNVSELIRLAVNSYRPPRQQKTFSPDPKPETT